MSINIGKVLTGLLTFFVGLIELILGLRFILKLLAASSTATFTLALYDASEPLVAAFEGVFPSFEAANFTLEISTILAMIVYGIVGFIFIYLARNFEGLTVTPGAKSGAPAITQAPQQPMYQTPVQAPPMQQPMQPMQQAPYQPTPPMQPIQTQPMPQQTYPQANHPMPQTPVYPTQPAPLNMPQDMSINHLSQQYPSQNQPTSQPPTGDSPLSQSNQTFTQDEEPIR